MELTITVDYPDRVQMLIKDDATEQDLDAVQAAMDGEPHKVLRIVCRDVADVHGAPREYLIRGGAIRCVDAKRNGFLQR